MTLDALLVSYSQVVTSVRRGSWSRKQKRVYSYVLSGLAKAKGLKRKVAFLTLTSSFHSVYAKRDLNRDFVCFKQSICRGGSFCDWWDRYPDLKGHCENCCFFYECKGRNIVSWEKFKLDYLNIRTGEGNGVLHLLCFMGYIPVRYLSNLWQRIHKSEVVWITSCYNYSSRIGSYLVSHYLSLQAHFIYVSMSRDWIFKGWRKVYDVLRKRMLKFSNVVMYGRLVAKPYGGFKSFYKAWETLLGRESTYKDFVDVDLGMFISVDI